VSGQLHALAALPPRNPPNCPLYTRLGGRQSRSGEEKNSSSISGVVTQPDALISIHLTDWAASVYLHISPCQS